MDLAKTVLEWVAWLVAFGAGLAVLRYGLGPRPWTEHGRAQGRAEWRSAGRQFCYLAASAGTLKLLGLAKDPGFGVFMVALVGAWSLAALLEPREDEPRR